MSKRKIWQQDKQWNTKHYTENVRLSNTKPTKTGVNSGAPDTKTTKTGMNSGAPDTKPTKTGVNSGAPGV
jgi:hypothetical protein